MDTANLRQLDTIFAEDGVHVPTLVVAQIFKCRHREGIVICGIAPGRKSSTPIKEILESSVEVTQGKAI